MRFVIWLLGIILVFLAGLPIGQYSLPLGWSVLLQLTLFGILLRWGPAISGVSYVRGVTMFSIAAFLTLLLNNGIAGTGSGVRDVYDTVFVWTILLSTLFLFVLVSRSQPGKVALARLKKMAISSAIIFAMSANWSLHVGYSFRDGGDFWIVALPMGASILLPHPYDYYVVRILLRKVTEFSLLCFLIFSAIYFLIRRSKLKSAQAGLSPKW